MNTERKYRKQVDRNGWMARLQRFTFGKVPRFTGYCPFFWLTWFCVLVLPFTLVIRLFQKMVTVSADAVELPTKRPSDDILIDLYKFHAWRGSFADLDLSHPDIRKALEWIQAHSDWQNCAKRAILKRDTAMQRRQERLARSEQRARTMVKYSGYIVKPLLIALGLTVGYFALRAIIFLFSVVTLQDLLMGGALILGGVALGAVFVGLAKLVVFVYRRTRRCPSNPERFGFLYTALMKVTSPIVAGIEFVADTVETIYTRECPLIEWGDESGPIQPFK